MLNASFTLLAPIIAFAISLPTDVSARSVSSSAIAPQGALVIATANGDVNVTSWNGATVEITADRSAATKVELDQCMVDVDATNGNVAVRAAYPNGTSHCRVSFEVKAPRGVHVEARATNGNVYVKEIAGTINVETSNGEIRVTNPSGTVDAGSTNGAIHIENPRGAVRTRTISGGIDITGARGDISAHAVSGDLNARFDALNSVAAVALSTTNGNVALSLPRNAGATIEASTVSGTIRGDLGVASREGYVGASLNRTIGDGRVKVQVKTVSGDVELTTP